MTTEEQLVAMTNSRNALLLSTDQLYQENQKALADHAKALADQATKHQEAITKLEQDHARAVEKLITDNEKIVADLKTEHNTDLAKVQSDLATANATIATRDTTITANNSEIAGKAAIIESLTNEKQNLQEQYDTCLANLTAEEALSESLQAKVTFLNSIRTYNPRILKGKAFYKRISQSDMETLLASDNPQLVIVGKTILAYRDNDWPVIIDSDDFQTLVGYIYMSNVFDAEEVAEVMRDATREEAYIT